MNNKIYTSHNILLDTYLNTFSLGKPFFFFVKNCTVLLTTFVSLLIYRSGGTKKKLEGLKAYKRRENYHLIQGQRVTQIIK